MKTRLIAVTAALFAAACTPPSPKDLALDASGEVKTMVHDALAATETTNGIEPVRLLTRGFSAASQGDAAAMAAPTVTSTSSDPSLDAMSRFFSERVFTEANVESTAGGAITFLLQGEDLCTDGTYAPDPTCVAQVNQLQVRIRATMPAAGAYDLTLLVGANRVEPLTFKIRKGQSLTLEVDLAKAKTALELFNSVMNGQPLGLPRVMEGVVQVKLAKNGAQDFTLSQSVLAAVRVEMDDADGFTTTVRTARAEPLTSARVDGVARRILLELALSETDVTVPYRNLSSTTVCTTDGGCTTTPNPSTALLALHLSGASATFDVQAGQTVFSVAHLGLGDAQSWVDFDGQRIFSTDLNPASGRHFDLRVAEDVDGLPLVSVVPEFDWRVHLAFAPLRAAGATIDSWLDGEDDALTFNGAATPTLKPVERFGQSTGAVKVVAGTVSLSTSRAGVAPLVAQAGQCITTAVNPPPGAHLLLGAFAVGPCP